MMIEESHVFDADEMCNYDKVNSDFLRGRET